MSTPEQSSRIMEFYCKIPFTENTCKINVNSNLTIVEFLEYVDSIIKNNLNINSKYDIILVEMGQPRDELDRPIEPSYDQTLERRYGTIYNMGMSVGFYVRPINPITRDYIRRENYNEFL